MTDKPERFEDCDLCLEFAGDSSHLPHGIDSRIIYSNPSVIAFPTIGCLVPGYVLICPRRHVSSVANLSGAGFDEFIAQVHWIRSLMSKEFGRMAIFEHGMGSEDERAGACVDHAHIHMLPTNELVDGALRTCLKDYERIPMTRLCDLAGHGYLLVSDGDQADVLVKRVAKLPSQLLRRVVAQAMGMGEIYDWAIFPGVRNMIMTRDRMLGQFSSSLDS